MNINVNMILMIHRLRSDSHSRPHSDPTYHKYSSSGPAGDTSTIINHIVNYPLSARMKPNPVAAAEPAYMKQQVDSNNFNIDPSAYPRRYQTSYNSYKQYDSDTDSDQDISDYHHPPPPPHEPTAAPTTGYARTRKDDRDNQPDNWEPWNQAWPSGSESHTSTAAPSQNYYPHTRETPHGNNEKPTTSSKTSPPRPHRAPRTDPDSPMRGVLQQQSPVLTH